MEFGDPNLFSGIRFFLAGFDRLLHDQVKLKLVSIGGVYVPNYSRDCTHVIVDELLLDDPICVAARRDRKTLVTRLWIDHSLEAGELQDVSNIMYRPLRDSNGIPGAEKLVICLTGYRKYQREDIMTMADLMGAQVSKELNVPKVTHLVCYKFEGEKYVMAKRFSKIKLINDYWLEDCLKAWKLLPEELYSRSTYELEMMEAQVNDSEDETGNIAASVTDPRVINGSVVQNETERPPDNPVIESKVSIPPEQGLSDSVRMDQLKLPLKTEQVSGSINLRNIDKYSPIHQNEEEQNVNKTPVKSSRLLHVGEDLGNLSGPSSKPSANFVTDYSSPVNLRQTPKSPNVSIGKLGSSSRKTKEIISEADVVKVTSASVRALNSTGLSEVTADKYSPLIPRRSSLSLQFEASPTVFERRHQEDLVEMVTVDVGATHITPKSQKLMASSSKIIDAADLATPVSSPLKNGTNGSPNMSGYAGDETARESVDKASNDFPSGKCKSNVEIIASSRSLPLEQLQVGKSDNMGVLTTPKSGKVASSGVKNKKVKLQNLPENASFSPELKKLVASNSGNPALNSDDQTGSSVSKPPSKKMVARKTLGSRPKVSKKTVDNQKCSLGGNVSGVNVDLHPASQIEGKDHVNSSVTDKVFPPLTIDVSTALEAKTLHINDDAGPLDDETGGAEVANISSENTDQQEVPEAKLKGIEHSKKNMALKKGISRQAKETAIREPKEVVQDANDVGKKANAKKKSVKGRTLAVAGKKRRSDQLVMEPVQVENESVASDDPGASDGGKSLRNLALKKRRGTLQLNKSDTLVEMEKEIESNHDQDGQNDGVKQPEELSGTSNSTKVLTVIENENGLMPGNGRCTNKGLKQTGKKRRCTMLLNKSDTPVEVEKKTELAPEKNDQHDGDGQSEKLSSLSNSAKVLTEIENENIPIAAHGPCTSGVKQTGRKRRGTRLVSKPEDCISEDKENMPVLDDDQHDGDQHSEKLTRTSNSAKVLAEIGNQNSPKAGNGRCTNNGVKQTGKKRRGTLLLSTSEDCTAENKENLEVLDGISRNDTIICDDQGAIKGRKKKRRGTLVLSKNKGPVELEKENEVVFHDHEDKSNGEALNSDLTVRKNNSVSSDTLTIQSDSTAFKNEPACFIVSGHRLQRKEFHQLIKRLKGKHCRDSHQWSYQATHFIVPDPIRRTEKFFAAAASGRWILKTDYLTASSQTGKFLPEEPYEWHKSGLTEDGAISLEAPRKWRLLREKTGHGAFYGMRIIVYGECIAPPLETLKRVIKAGDGTILATSPPYTRFLKSGVDFAIVSPGITRVDTCVQEFLRNEIPCVSADYLVEYVCKPGYPLDRHVQYNTHEWAAKSVSRLSDLLNESFDDVTTPENQVSDDLACQVCGFSDRAEVMLVCGDESGSTGCGVGTHIDCCDPPLEDVPDEDWFCPNCS